MQPKSVFSTRVEVFLSAGGGVERGGCLLHARGGVSEDGGERADLS